MSKRSELGRRIRMKAASIREDSVPAYLRRPVFTLSGNKELVAQGGISVEKYTEQETVIKVSGMTVSACGRGLTMCFYNKTTVKLSGYITSVSFCEE